MVKAVRANLLYSNKYDNFITAAWESFLFTLSAMTDAINEALSNF